MVSKVVIVGGGKGGSALLELLHGDKNIKIVSIVDVKSNAMVIPLAKKYKIPFTGNLEKCFEKNQDVDLIFDCTGNHTANKVIQKVKPENAEIIGGVSARLMWDLIDERIKARQALETRLKEHQSLYQLGLSLTQSQNLSEIFNTVVKSALDLTNSPAGSLAVFDEASGEMYFGSAVGFSSKFLKEQVWRVRKGGLTSFILNQDRPVAIADVSKFAQFDNPVLLKEGIKSLIAIPLKAEGKIQGILYVDDFRPRKFSESELSIIMLLANMAAIAIERTKLLESTRIMAITDELTKLYNLRHFLNRLAEEIKRAKRYGRPLSLAMIDIDHFKQYNDTYGHIHGNKVLKKVAMILEKESRHGDIVARYGGEEFAIIMLETDKVKSKQFAERMRSKIEKSLCREDFKVCITISVGIANYPDDALDASSLIERSDEALYKAKRDGRNCIRLVKARVKQLKLTEL
ncbi:MAG: GGDEF domain-containing protein [Actinobacteria bacterium]|nr:MAG: GGDEF domain-containing protein [Actinomycetota bacterium]